jgi:hypothetical protein
VTRFVASTLRRRGDGRRVRPFGAPRDGAPGAGGPTAHGGHRAGLAEGYATAAAEPQAERVRRPRSLQVGHHVAVAPLTVPLNGDASTMDAPASRLSLTDLVSQGRFVIVVHYAVGGS